MDRQRFRQVLATFLGPDRYREFIKDGGTRYWQEKSWEQFTVAHPEWAISKNDMREALSICWVHETELLTETILAVDGVPDYRGYTIRQCSSLFPCSAMTLLLWSESCPFPSRTVVVSYCPACREAFAKAHPDYSNSIDWDRFMHERAGGNGTGTAVNDE